MDVFNFLFDRSGDSSSGLELLSELFEVVLELLGCLAVGFRDLFLDLHLSLGDCAVFLKLGDSLEATVDLALVVFAVVIEVWERSIQTVALFLELIFQIFECSK
jgi:hypothetical protein